MNPRSQLAPAMAVLALTASLCFALGPPPITDLAHFFVYNSGGIPKIDESWRLKVDGAVATPLSLDLQTMKQYRAITKMATLECAIAGGTTLLVGNAVWTGVSLKTLIKAAGLLPDASSVRFSAVDGYLFGDCDLATILSSDRIILAYEMNGQTLPLSQGYPLRLVVPGAGGFNWVQWVERIEITTAPPTLEFNYLPQHARILRPRPDENIAMGTYTIRGMAVSGTGREITRVEVSTDGGLTWRDAELTSEFVPYVWKHWRIAWQIPRLGRHSILARTYDDTGTVQGEQDGYGWRGFVVGVNVKPNADGNGIGDACDNNCPDLDGRNPISFRDFAILASAWRVRDSGTPAGDLNGDGTVNALDLQILARYWLSTCCPP
jgi:DMSO/TMAO reductase YedYZ molybdopterin-dependent catalytic subunit